MKTSFLAFFVFLFSQFASIAQENTYQVLAAKGNILVNGKNITSKTALNVSQTIEVADDSSYLTLISKDNKEVIEVSKKGSFKMSELPKTTLTSDYEKFVVDEMTEIIVENGTTKNRFQHMNKTGSVKAGEKMSPIRSFLHSGKNKIFGDKINIRWYLDRNILYKESVFSYKIRISNLDENIFFLEKTTKTQITLKFSDIKNLESEELLVVKIFPLDKDDKELGSPASVDGDAITRLSKEDHQKISQELSAITKLKDTALAKLVEARFFEDKELYIDAINAYEDALKLSFGAKEVQKVYQFFLERNGLAVSEE